MIKKIFFLSIVTGILTSITVSAYTLFSKYASYLLFLGSPEKTIPTLPVWYIYLVPTFAIFIVNFLILKNETVKEYGVKTIAQSVAENKISITIQGLIAKMFASSLSIASGFAVGNEGPSAEIGAMIAYRINKLLKLPIHFINLSLSIGASCGITTVFVSPVTGIMFAIETIAYEFLKDYILYIILGSCISFAIALNFLEPLIFQYSHGKILNYDYLYSTAIFIPFVTFCIYLYMGLKSIINYIFNSFLRKTSHELIIKSIVGGIAIGTILTINPFAAFSGESIVEYLINNKYNLPISLIFIIMGLRVVSTSFSINVNAVGGLFLPLMSIGALGGYGFGEILNGYFTIEPFYFAAIGAASFVGVVMELPMTAIVLALEMSYDYNIVVPTAITVAIATLLVKFSFNIKKLQFYS